ncbi:hypothetical protein HMPREF1401_00842 [Helicobacter pylori GAM120Ai]|uniref:Uncharacterized protein n=1 Tax=Helicobacter pylori GAM120Ai TaxID=1159029 RepID=A0AAV3IF91_HELPX|nr:hypothetical protein HMPREF1401_00842 [Helicobacter pylori GAM120Ai]
MLKRLAIKQPFKTALAPILGLVFKKASEFLTFLFHFSLRYGCFWLCDTKTF